MALSRVTVLKRVNEGVARVSLWVLEKRCLSAVFAAVTRLGPSNKAQQRGIADKGPRGYID